MYIDDIRFITGNLHKDSVKKACYIVREYMRCEKTGNLDICAVSKDEYNEALRVLLAYSYQTSDNNTVAEQWLCDSDCDRNNGIYGFCPGEFQIDNHSGKKLCKHYVDSFNK